MSKKKNKGLKVGGGEPKAKAASTAKAGCWMCSIPKAPAFSKSMEVEAEDVEAAKEVYFAACGIRSTVHPVVIVEA